MVELTVFNVSCTVRSLWGDLWITDFPRLLPNYFRIRRWDGAVP